MVHTNEKRRTSTCDVSKFAPYHGGALNSGYNAMITQSGPECQAAIRQHIAGLIAECVAWLDILDAMNGVQHAGY